MRRLWVTLVVALVSLAQTQAKCKVHHATWLSKAQGPSVTQASRSHPDKVKVSWQGQLENQRCVDKYSVFYWRKSLDTPLQVSFFKPTILR